MKRLLLILLCSLILSTTATAQNDDEILAKINDTPLTIKDLDFQTRQVIEGLPRLIEDLRKRELQNEINKLLFESEAKTQKISVSKLLETNVLSRVSSPSAQQVEAVYQANQASFEGKTFEQAKSRIINYLRRESENQLSNDFAEKLKSTHKVTSGVDVNDLNLKPADILVTVDAQTLTAERFNERLRPLEYNLRFDVYQQKQVSVENTIFSNLIFLEAKKRGVQPEVIIQQEVTEKVKTPTEIEARKFFDAQKPKPKVAFESAKTEVISFLEQQQIQSLQIALRDKLLRQNKIQVLFKQPEPPILNIKFDANAPSKGNRAAKVIVVMFTDFQCSACAQTHPIIQEVMRKYNDRARLVVRDFPLTEVHDNAFVAAEAAQAAHAQGKFFEYTEILYKNQNALDIVSLKKYAAQIGLSPQRFASDLTSGKFAASIRQSRLDGESYGINATPTIFVNGVKVLVAKPQDLQNAIEKALAKK